MQITNIFCSVVICKVECECDDWNKDVVSYKLFLSLVLQVRSPFPPVDII